MEKERHGEAEDGSDTAEDSDGTNDQVNDAAVQSEKASAFAALPLRRGDSAQDSQDVGELHG